MSVTTFVSAQFLRKQKVPAGLKFDGKWQTAVCFAGVLPERVGPETLSQRRLYVVAQAPMARARYTILAQSREEVTVPDNSPSVSMWPYLVTSGQTRRLNGISVYAHRSVSRDQARTLYMNAGAMELWREMGKPGLIVGESNRPPWNAYLSFGIPFSR